MSNFNYMDNVPVKIAEKYKPPPRIYQLPQSVTNKLNLPDAHFYEGRQYSYDFQLERKILAKIPEYMRRRQIEREARQERHDNREKEHQRRIEEQHKQMLGAVSYPNAAELSSSSDDDDDDSEQTKRKEKADAFPFLVNKDVNWLGSHSFNNILQPTVLTHNSDENNMSDSLTLSYGYKHATPSTNSGSSGNSNKLSNTFNYKDFEDDTSSPFDNIELKTIDDLDILRQVLHNTQLKANIESADLKDSNGLSNSSENDVKITQNTKENTEGTLITSTLSANDTPDIVNDVSTLANTKAALEKVNFGDMNLGLEQQPLQIDNIPTHNYKSIHNYYCRSDYHPSTATALHPSSTCYVQSYSNGVQDQHNYQSCYQNYLYSSNCNSNTPSVNKTLTEYSNFNPTSTALAHQTHYIFKNANNLLPRQDQLNNIELQKDTQIQQVQEEDVQSTKSRSVPDLFQELRDEVHNSEMRRRRSRNFSHNFDGSKDPKVEKENNKHLADLSPTNAATEKLEDTLEYFNKLTTAVKALARNISLMGFPLGRVARIAKIYGEDDKKIVEHLIPLTELLDLGFDETQISEALLKFDNNKEKALEHLIT